MDGDAGLNTKRTAGSVYAAYESQLPLGSLATVRETAEARRESMEEKEANTNLIF